MSRERGLYEVLVTEALAEQLRRLEGGLQIAREPLRAAEVSDRIGLHLSRIVQRALAAVDDKQRVKTAIDLARRLIDEVAATLHAEPLLPERPLPEGELLRALLARLPDGTPETLEAPLIPLLDTTLLTNAPGEPRVGHQVVTEIRSADRIDMLMAFIRASGLAPMLGALRDHCAAGRGLRVLTTTYTGSTEARALDQLRELGADVRVSYDTSTTRLHAKAWLFHRRSGFSTAYIGSSNLTHSAQVSGLEWNVRVSGARNPDVVGKVAAVFESYWNGGDFVAYDSAGFLERTAATRETGPRLLLSPIELRLEPFQERLLEQLGLARQRGHHRNLLVSATGTGKTVMAAVDFGRLRQELSRARLLFVAHREEILDQSLATFRHALRDPSFGELWVGGRRPRRFEHVFASIQSLYATGFDDLPPDHFDVVIVDEFHHAPAEGGSGDAGRSYRALLDHVRPLELLGLTATPERSDGLPVLGWFEGRIAAELRLWDAIDQHRLVPFVYYGVYDGLDLTRIPWRRGRGYDVAELSNLLTASDVWARQVIHQLERYTGDVHRIRALGFCVSVDHARHMARAFRDAGIAAKAVWADTPDDERQAALRELGDGKTNVVFSVDLFNEGVDVPNVDTLLMLRPTDSGTLFLQQLGRGLRRSPGKTVCTVLDFVSLHSREFRFDRRLRALLGSTRSDLIRQVEEGFPFLPAGCHFELDEKASDVVLRNLRDAIPSQWDRKVEELRLLAGQGAVPTLASYLEASLLDVEDVYAGDRSWSELCAAAGLSVAPPGSHEAALRRACGRLLHVDDAERLDAYRAFLGRGETADPDRLPARERRLLRMLVGAMMPKGLPGRPSLAEGCKLLWSHPQVIAELREVLEVLADRVEHMVVPLATHPDVPLQVHARYTRIEILAAFGMGDGAKVAPWQTGVYWAPAPRADLLAFTLDKTVGQFSPTTRYRDYAISRDLIHWESQSVTRADGPTGRRYQRHEAEGSTVMLFARINTAQRAFVFLGPASYVSHEGELPMAVTWRLRYPLPGDLYATFAAAVA